MLYIEPNEYGNIEEFIFDARPYNEDINLSDIAALEQFFKRSGYLPEKYVEMFLNYVIYQARRKVITPPDSPLNASFSGTCSSTAAIINDLMGRMGFKVDVFNVGDVLNTEKIHQLTIVHVPVLIDDEVVVKDYLMDPTFRQYCTKEPNRFERYFEEPRQAVAMSTPFPGYFFNLTKEGKKFANHLITYGYFETTDDNLKQYFDPFRLYITPKEEYDDKSLGLISSTNLTGNYYRESIKRNIEKDFTKSRYNIETPMEKIIAKKKKFLYRIKNYFGLAELYESDLELEKEFTK